MNDRPGSTFTHGVVEVFGHAVGHASAGSGPDTLVICPGSAGSDASWAKDQLAERMHVIELNPPGWGGSPALAHKMDQRELSVVLVAAIDALGVERFHLHGASMGGVTALWLAMQFPDRVRTLTTEGGMNFAWEEHLVNPQNVQRLREMVERNDPDAAGYPRAAPHARKPWSDDDYIRAQMRKRIPMMRMLTNAHESDLERRMRNFHIPTLAMLGDQDELLKSNHLDRWREVFPGVHTLLIPGAAHDIQNTEPEQLVEAVVRFHASVR